VERHPRQDCPIRPELRGSYAALPTGGTSSARTSASTWAGPTGFAARLRVDSHDPTRINPKPITVNGVSGSFATSTPRNTATGGLVYETSDAAPAPAIAIIR